MTRRVAFAWMAGVCLTGLFLAGCAKQLPSQSPVSASPLTPAWDEWRVADQVLIITDASGTTYYQGTFPTAKALTQGFVAAMPDGAVYSLHPGSYKAGSIAFGGSDRITQPMSPFDRSRLSQSANSLRVLGSVDGMGGLTPLDQVLREADQQIVRGQGAAAVLLITDGRVFETGSSNDEAAVLDVAQDLVGNHDAGTCIHVVQLGSDPAGEWMLRELAALNGCGSYRRASEVQSAAAMTELARSVFMAKIPDADADGVLDDRDRCLDTASGAPVAKSGRYTGCWLITPIEFDTAKHTLRPKSKQILKEVAAILRANPDVRIQVDGHADWRGSTDYNYGLSIRREREAMNFLVQNGAGFTQVNSYHYSELQPIASNKTAEGMQRNRRVQLEVIRHPRQFDYYHPKDYRARFHGSDWPDM